MNNQNIKALCMLRALVTYAAKDNGIISIHTQEHIEIAQEMIANGFLYEIAERSTDDPNERCYMVTEAGIKKYA